MRTAGIICEYNPFHPGHRYQILELRRRLGEETGVLCLMSGNYVQRGAPAIYDKWRRTKDALEGGADLVLELPLTVAVSAAGSFASGGVDCLHRLQLVDFLCFGSEQGSREQLLSTAEAMESPAFAEKLRERLAEGVSYPRARTQALEAMGVDAAPLGTPNSSLGVDYLRRMLETDAGMEPLMITRNPEFPAASELRAGLIAAGAPSIHTLEQGERAMLAVLRTLPDSAFEAAPFGGEGLWRKVMSACRKEATVDEILFACKSKRYTLSRLRRMLLCLFLGLTDGDLRRTPPYLHVLGFNDRGRQMLRTMKQTSEIPLVTKRLPDDLPSREYAQLERRAADLYGLFAPPGTQERTGREQTENVIRV